MFGAVQVGDMVLTLQFMYIVWLLGVSIKRNFLFISNICINVLKRLFQKNKTVVLKRAFGKSEIVARYTVVLGIQPLYIPPVQTRIIPTN